MSKLLKFDENTGKVIINGIDDLKYYYLYVSKHSKQLPKEGWDCVNNLIDLGIPLDDIAKVLDLGWSLGFTAGLEFTKWTNGEK